MYLLPNTQLNKRYRIHSMLSKRPYGAMYRAYDTKENRHVAIKAYHKWTPEFEQRFRTHARRLRKLDHPQLPQIRDEFSIQSDAQQPGGLFLVSEFIEGTNLEELTKQYGVLPTELLVTSLQGAAEAVEYIHSQEQLHLNIKPANIIISPQGGVFLVDTGLTGTGLPLETTGFDAPEMDKQVSSDIFGLGATLYGLLTGRAPADALSVATGFADKRSAREINPDAEPYLSVAASRAMDKNPSVRYNSVAKFKQALSRPSRESAVLAPPVPSIAKYEPDSQFTPPPMAETSHRGRTSRRGIDARTLIALIFLAVSLVSGSLWFLTRETDDAVVGGQSSAEATLAVAESRDNSEIINSLTALAPTATVPPTATIPPTPTPGPITTETGMQMLYIPSTDFRFGYDAGEEDESPSVIINLSSFYFDMTEVTNEQYAECVRDGSCTQPQNENATYHDAYYGDQRYDQYPVIFVDWQQANQFCSWRGARLPSEAEWEMLAGYDPVAGFEQRYPWGDEFDGTKLNFCDNNCGSDGDTRWNDQHQDTAPVGSYADGRSPLGANDMMGNVMEWVGDWYDPNYYVSAPAVDPRGPTNGESKSIRGSSWLTSGEDVFVTTRSWRDPLVANAHIGFRCAASASALISN